MILSNGRATVSRIGRMAARKNNIVSQSMAAAATTTSRGFVSATQIVLEKHITKVPTMGDSITEGTIVEWLAQVGQRVEEEDVVALIETDKVTVDIKATQAGVITQQFGAIDDEVEVGADLYEIDTEAEATVEATAASEPAAAPAAAEVATPEPTSAPTPAATAPTTSSSEPAKRVPSIQFLGKEGWAQALTPEPEFIIPATYGRLEFSEEEMEALMLGGANMAPEVDSYSSGATFSA